MATTYTLSGALSFALSAVAAASVDANGSLNLAELDSFILAAAGGSAPTISGWLNGVFVAAAGDILLAHATDPLGTMGDAGYFPPGFTVASTKIKAIRIRNNDLTNSVTIISKASVGAPIFLALGDGVTLQPNGGELILVFPAGTAALTTTSNDALTISISGGSPSCEITVLYGP